MGTRYLYADWPDRKPLSKQLALLSQAEMVRRIEELRAEDGPLCCPTCGSTATPPRRRKVCPGCDLEHPITRFHRNPTRSDGRDHYCVDCKQRMDARRRPRKIALGRAS